MSIEREMNAYKLTDSDLNGCEGCQHCKFAGIRWPASPDGYMDLSYVDRCDYCELYDSDEEAAKALAEYFDVRWGYANRTNPTEIRWAPEEGDSLDYTGWSCFIDHEARDSTSPTEWTRVGNNVTLHLNPGEARVVLDALIEARVGIAAEWQAGEMFAIAQGKTLEALQDRVRQQLYPPTGDDA